jgi:hypothetical protein
MATAPQFIDVVRRFRVKPISQNADFFDMANADGQEIGWGNVSVSSGE